MKNKIPAPLLISILILFFATKSLAQTNKIDSLRKCFLIVKNNSAQKELLLNLCDQYYSMPADSLLKYVTLGLQLSPENSLGYFRFKNFYCTYLFTIDKNKEAIALTNQLLSEIKKIKNGKNVELEILGNQCKALIRNDQVKEAYQRSLEFLQYSEQLKDTTYIIRSYTLLGWTNMELLQFKDAIRWLNIGNKFTSGEKFNLKKGNLYSNIAACYDNIGKVDSANYFIELALHYFRLSENLSGIANALNIRAGIHINLQKNNEAENDMIEALEVRQKIGDLFFIVSDMAKLSSFYASVNKTDKGIAVALQGIELARKTKNLSKLIYLYEALSDNYHVAYDNEKYAASLQTIISLKDSLYNQNSEDAIAEMQTKYELQKKENIIINQKYSLDRNRYFTIGSTILFILTSLLIWLFYRNYRLSQQRKMVIAMAEQKKLSFEAVQHAKEDERKRIAADLHDNLGSYAAAITANVRYLKEGNHDTNEFMTQLDDNAQNMVTQLGDTIWVLKNEHLLMTKLADRLKAWLQRIMMNYPDVKYHYSEEISNDIEFTPAYILHIFLILKECVNNALKHSQCSDLRITIISNESWTITIEDNGKGFDASTIPKGSGIDNIIYRAKECEWIVEWLKAEPTGTIIKISGSTTK